ncbi:MAG: bifunctional phosphopantothenoylcysteine decarboxylase/phosphopantothenate--cysteine ligase CoaBC [Deltaproteobacteria bacterium]|nr:bifunctional phosphopantothenoylcysteine decarboxylase/phosphopantothenate--cysteine ligase CoaBC [Deltaproteobacteria bacterium]
MQRLSGSHVVVGVAGSIAAYRACDVVRGLKAQGASVRVAPTRGAQAFVTPLLLEALSGKPCLLTSLDVEHGRIPHVEEAYQAGAVVVVPASADLLAKMAAGFADEAVLSLLLSFQGPVIVAPAMESHMWSHPATQHNVATLKARGVVFVGPIAGPLASGRSGQGRLADVDDVVEFVVFALVKKDFTGKRVLVTAGPTVEDLDPVRSITNRSSGKMGVAVARELALRGAVVDVVHGPLRIPLPTTPGLRGTAVRSAKEMAEAVFARADDVDIAILAAAVADFTPKIVATHKIKKSAGPPTIELTSTTDILLTLGQSPRVGRLLVGFAAETEEVENRAHDKRERKGCALVIGNDVSAVGSGFDVDTNRVFLARDPLRGPSLWLPQLSKEETAARIVDELKTLLG